MSDWPISYRHFETLVDGCFIWIFTFNILNHFSRSQQSLPLMSKKKESVSVLEWHTLLHLYPIGLNWYYGIIECCSWHLVTHGNSTIHLVCLLHWMSSSGHLEISMSHVLIYILENPKNTELPSFREWFIKSLILLTKRIIRNLP